MIIRYPKKHIIADLVVGSLYLLAGILGMIFGSGFFIEYAFIALGLLYLGSSFYKLNFQYLKLESQILTCYLPGSKKSINLTEVTQIKRITDEIAFLTPYKKLKISTKLIAREDLPVFKKALADLDLGPEKNPFSQAV